MAVDVTALRKITHRALLMQEHIDHSKSMRMGKRLEAIGSLHQGLGGNQLVFLPRHHRCNISLYIDMSIRWIS